MEHVKIINVLYLARPTRIVLNNLVVKITNAKDQVLEMIAKIAQNVVWMDFVKNTNVLLHVSVLDVLNVQVHFIVNMKDQTIKTVQQRIKDIAEFQSQNLEIIAASTEIVVMVEFVKTPNVPFHVNIIVNVQIHINAEDI